MKRIMLIVITVLISVFAFSQTTATNFTVYDCDGVSHDLFTELDAGKIIVIDWVMPCYSCIAPTLTAYNEIQNFAALHPGQILFYLVDDAGNTDCTTLKKWAANNGIVNVKVFSNAVIKMTDYGSSGMPKVVVLDGTNHNVLFNQNYGVDVTNFNNAINQALLTGIAENNNSDFSLSLYPNPMIGCKTTLKFNLSQRENVLIDIFNITGEKVKSFKNNNSSSGNNIIDIDLNNISEGVYFLKLSVADKSQIIKFIVSN